MVTAAGGSRRAGAFLLFVIAVTGTVYPPAFALVRDGMLGAFRYLAADSFYYLTVATRSVGAPAFTFDGVHPTNGFHPLWQVLLGWSFAWLPLDSSERVNLAFGAGIALVALGTGLFAVAVLRLTGRPALSLLAAVPGAFAFLVPGQQAGTPWSFANGMESPLSICLFGLLLVLLTGRLAPTGRHPAREILAVSSLLTLLTLSRLDDVFLFAPFLLYLGWSAGSRRDALRRLAAAAAPPVLLLGSYLAYNLVRAGSLLPSSGTSKAEPLYGLARNTYAALTTLAPFLDVLHRAGDWTGESWRIAQMLIPAFVAAAWLVARGRSAIVAAREGARPGEVLVSLLAGYVILKAAYNFAMVPLWHQGHWYFPVSIMSCNLVVALAVGRGLDALRAQRGEGAHRPRHLAPLALAGATVFALWSASAYVAEQREPRPRDRRYVFWQERAETLARLQRECPGCGVLSFDDGIIAYSLSEVSTLNGLGLTMDAEALTATREGRLLELAWQRGIRFLASVSYEMPDAAFADPESLRAHLETYPFLRGQPLEGWRFRIAFESPASGVRFVRFFPAAER